MKETPLQVLLVQDGTAEARTLQKIFVDEQPDRFELVHVGGFSEARTYLASGRPDVILLDLASAQEDSAAIVRQARAMAPDTPVILLAGPDDEAAALGAKMSGAQDYLLKGQMEYRALPRTLQRAVQGRRMEADLGLMRAYQARFEDEFLSHVSHELRSPLNSIYQFVTILLDGLAGELNPEQSGHLAIVLRNVQHLQVMVNDLFEAADVEDGLLLIEPQPASPGDAILETIHTLQFAAAAKKIDLSAELEGPLPMVCADPARLRQILGILVENAVKFTPELGSVKITARAAGRDLLFEVCDSGCGIHAEFVDRIFERMFQTPEHGSSARRGLGLGLYICKDLVTRQEGQIRVTSAPGKGTTFSVSLPIFSLSDRIRPLVGAGSPLALMVIEMVSQSGWLSPQARAKRGAAVREYLQQHLSGERAVLLPRMGFTGGVELFFVVVAGNEAHIGNLAAQMHDGLYAMGHSLQSGLRYFTSHWSPGSLLSQPSSEAEVEKLAEKFQWRIEEEISQRMERDAQ